MWKNILITVLLLIIAAGVIYIYSIQTRELKKPPMDGEIVMEDSLFLRPEFRRVLDEYMNAINKQYSPPKIVLIYQKDGYFSPQPDNSIEQSFILESARTRSHVFFKKPIGYFRYRNQMFLLLSSVYSILQNRDGILHKIDKEYKMLGDDILENTKSSVPEVSDYETWKVIVKVNGDKIKVEHRRYSGLEDLNLPPLD